MKVNGFDPEELEREAAREPSQQVSIIPAADIRPEPIDWVWNGWIARGKVHVLAGAPGTGKTSLALAIAATLTTGGWWPDRTAGVIGSVLIWSGEDDPKDTLVPRLIACGADLRRVHFIAGVVDHTGTRAFDPATDGQVLSEEIALMDPPPTLLIVDPIVAAVAGDSHKNAEVRRALQPLVDLAQVRRCAVLGISHFSKGTAGRDPVERVTGSLAFGALARVVLAAAKLPDAEGGGRMLARAKNNIAMDSGGFKYELVPLELPGYPGVFTTLVRWGEALKGTARELLGRAETAVDPDERSATDEAAEWLRELLSAGPMKAADVQKEARQAGINDKPLRTARERLGVKPKKSGFSAGWWWSLPAAEDALSAEDAQDAKVRISGSFEPGEGNFGPGPCPGDPEGAQDAPSCPSENEGTFEDGGHLRELATTSTGGARDGDGWESF